VIKRSNNFKEAKLLVLNINKSKKELKWKPRLSLNETIELTVNWYKNYFANKKMSKITIEQIENFKNISRFKIN
jgi:CDP-glucose 4,6-dehydratase